MINISRDPRWGRIHEAFGEDPYLTSRMAVAYVKGTQGDDPKYLKLAATVKHYAVNNQESARIGAVGHGGRADAARVFSSALPRRRYGGQGAIDHVGLQLHKRRAGLGEQAAGDRYPARPLGLRRLRRSRQHGGGARHSGTRPRCPRSKKQWPRAFARATISTTWTSCPTCRRPWRRTF